MRSSRKFKHLTILRIQDIMPINSGGSYVSYFYISLFSNFFQKSTLFFFERRSQTEKGIIAPETYTKIYIRNKLNKLFIFKPIRRMHVEQIFSSHIFTVLDQTDLIYLDFPYLFPISRKIKKKFKVPILLFSHNIEWMYYKESGSYIWPLLKYYEKYVWNNVDGIVTLSKRDYTLIKREVSTRTFYIPPVINKTVFYPPKTHKKSKNKLKVLFYGRLDIPQNQTALSFIVEKLIPKFKDNPNVRFIIFGSGRNYIKIPSYSNVKFLGEVTNPASIVRDSDVVIVPIKNSAGTKVRILEALYCGKPVITTIEGSLGLDPKLKKIVEVCLDERDWTDKLNKFIEMDSDFYQNYSEKILNEISRYDSEIKKKISKDIKYILYQLVN